MRRMGVAAPAVYAGLRPRITAFAFDYVLIAAYIAVLVTAGVLVRGIAPGAHGSALRQPSDRRVYGLRHVDAPGTPVLRSVRSLAGRCNVGQAAAPTPRCRCTLTAAWVFPIGAPYGREVCSLGAFPCRHLAICGVRAGATGSSYRRTDRCLASGVRQCCELDTRSREPRTLRPNRQYPRHQARDYFRSSTRPRTLKMRAATWLVYSVNIDLQQSWLHRGAVDSMEHGRGNVAHDWRRRNSCETLE
jgi:hypothetical protein